MRPTAWVVLLILMLCGCLEEPKIPNFAVDMAMKTCGGVRCPEETQCVQQSEEVFVCVPVEGAGGDAGSGGAAGGAGGDADSGAAGGAGGAGGEVPYPECTEYCLEYVDCILLCSHIQVTPDEYTSMVEDCLPGCSQWSDFNCEEALASLELCN